MDNENNAAGTAVAKKEPKGFKRKEAFRITQKNWDSENNKIDFKGTADEISAAIGVDFNTAKGYIAWFAKENHRDFIIPGLKAHWEKDLKGTRLNAPKTAGDGGTKASTTKEASTKPKTEKTGGSEATRSKLKDVLQKRKMAGTDALGAALAAAHPEKPNTIPQEGEKVAA